VTGRGDRFFASRGGRSLRAFRHRQFAVLWSSNLVGQLGFALSWVTFQWLVAGHGRADAVLLGLLFFFTNMPFVFVSPFGGLLADRWERRRMVASIQAAIGVVAGVLAVLIYAGAAPLGVVFVFATAIGSLLALNAPAFQAMAANVIPAEDLASAISLQSVGLNLARVAGPALAAPLLIIWGAAPSYVVYATTSLVVAVAVARMRIPPATYARARIGAWAGIRAGVAHARERPPAAAVLVLVAATAIFGSSYVAMLPLFAYDVLHGGDGTFTALFAASAAGAVVGGLAAGQRARAPGLVEVATLVLGFGLVLCLFSLAAARGSLPLALVFAGAAGAANFSSMTSFNAMLQFLSDEDKRGRIMSLYMLAWGGCIPLGTVPLGAAAGHWGIAVSQACFGVACGTCGAIGLVRARAARVHEHYVMK
jgi:MFS family permease